MAPCLVVTRQLEFFRTYYDCHTRVNPISLKISSSISHTYINLGANFRPHDFSETGPRVYWNPVFDTSTSCQCAMAFFPSIHACCDVDCFTITSAWVNRRI
jgi:hypothetical protein